MTLYIKETGETKTITMRVWDGNQWGVDFFADAECNVKDMSEVTSEQYNDIIKYWESEISLHNSGEYTEQFGDANGSEIGLFHD